MITRNGVLALDHEEMLIIAKHTTNNPVTRCMRGAQWNNGAEINEWHLSCHLLYPTYMPQQQLNSTRNMSQCKKLESQNLDLHPDFKHFKAQGHLDVGFWSVTNENGSQS